MATDSDCIGTLLILTFTVFLSSCEAADTPVTIFLYRILGADDILDLTDEDCSRFNNTPVGEEQDFSIGEIELKKEIWQVRQITPLAELRIYISNFGFRIFPMTL